MALAAVWSLPSIFAPGIDATARDLLRIGVALLGTQISAEVLHVLDPATIAVLAGSVLAILVAGRLLAPIIGIDPELALIAAGSVAICGASAALAFGLVLAQGQSRERDVACTVGAVSVLSMGAMLAYPFLARALGFDLIATGVFLGGTIQEVPHAVAAGYGIDLVTGNVATTTKLLRVAMLGPALMLVATAVRGGVGAGRMPFLLPPLFLVVFVAFAVLNVSGLLPRMVAEGAGPLSRFLVVMAMAAIGLKMQWRSLTAYGWRPVLLLLVLSALLVVLVASFLIQGRF
jgi:uncharacterized integral membrane protein (TIGR00698 family)